MDPNIFSIRAHLNLRPMEYELCYCIDLAPINNEKFGAFWLGS